MSRLKVLVPKAVRWAEAQSSHILSKGVPLSDRGLLLARQVGVNLPDSIRILLVPRLPVPSDPVLAEVDIEAGLLAPEMVGMTLGHGIYICDGHMQKRLLSHEFRHVQQYEQAGSVAAFLPVYLEQVAQFGYANAPLEIDARTHEVAA